MFGAGAMDKAVNSAAENATVAVVCLHRYSQIEIVSSLSRGVVQVVAGAGHTCVLTDKSNGQVLGALAHMDNLVMVAEQARAAARPKIF